MPVGEYQATLAATGDQGVSDEEGAMQSMTAADTPTRTDSCSLLRLHDRIAKGQGDDPSADAIRAEMDPPWHGSPTGVGVALCEKARREKKATVSGVKGDSR
jgi:hypothetical protein